MLYKYLPERFADAFIGRGEVLFRSLSYFRAVEHAARGDEIEGVHVDAPDNDVTLETSTGLRIVGPHRFLNSIDQDRTYAFCCSTEFNASLFDEFDAGAPRRLDALSRLTRLASSTERWHISHRTERLRST
jgi:hypothetical protein